MWRGRRQLNDLHALRVNLIPALLKRVTYQWPRPLWQLSLSQIVAHRAWPNAQKGLQGCAATKGRNQSGNICFVHPERLHKNSKNEFR
jgi:hypothetical protein